jgi:hypothetical protein
MIQLRANGTFAPQDAQKFTLDPSEYEAIIQRGYDAASPLPGRITVTFGDGSSTPRNIATALGDNGTVQSLIVQARDATTGALLVENEIILADGIGSQGLDFVPTAFLQGAVGLGYGLELKARFIPKIETDDFESGFYGGGLQWEISRLFVGNSIDGADELPVAISLLAAYTKVDLSYDFEDGTIVNGTNQRIESQADVFNFSLIAGTNWKTFNLYGGVNYLLGNTLTNLNGEYVFVDDSIIFPQNSTLVDPVAVESETSGILGTVGAKLTLGAFNINADYTIGEFQTLSASVFFRI